MSIATILSTIRLSHPDYEPTDEEMWDFYEVISGNITVEELIKKLLDRTA